MRTCLALVLTLLATGADAGERFDATAMMRLKRLSDPQVSPDGRHVAYVATDVNLEQETRNNDIWSVSLDGGVPRPLTDDAKSDTRPRWSPDGKRIAFISARDGTAQAFLMNVDGGDERKLTSLSTGVDAVLWIDAKTLLVVTQVFPDCGADNECNRKRLDTAGKPPSARVYDGLLVRHWDTWDDGRASTLLAVSAEDGKVLRNLTPGARDVPPFSVGGPDDYAVSPDGTEVCFGRKDEPVEAISTNADLYVVPVAGGQPRRISASAGYDGAPAYSPDGAMIAFRSQERAGYESDRWRLMAYDRRSAALRELTAGFDRHVEAITWSADSKTIYFTAGDGAREPIFAVPAAGGAVRKIADGHSFSELQGAPDGRTLVASQASLTAPAEIVRVAVGSGEVTALTHANDATLARHGLQPGESVSYTGAAGKSVQAWIVMPPDFDASRKYPLVVLIHGGPQGVWGDAWSYRWNPQVFASAGYVVFMPNPRGSIGWGQEFIDDIKTDWGGRAYEDVMKGTDFAEALPYVDASRTAAAGASYGGYLVNWIAGHTDRFDALVSHDGLFDLRAMYGSTEELWFVEWEFQGPFWKSPDVYERWSPSRHVASFKTPTLVIHGELDYRVPIEQGLGMFTALQRQGVPSRLVVFPDENHWVLKPVNSVRWYGEVTGWLDRWLKTAPTETSGRVRP